MVAFTSRNYSIVAKTKAIKGIHVEMYQNPAKNFFATYDIHR
jgi:hypothetical protein